MNLMELGAIGELVGGVAVIASLLYVGLQVRHSSRVAEASMNFQILTIANDHSSLTIRDPELGQLASSGQTDPESLSDREWERFVEYAYVRFGIWEEAFLNRRSGVVNDETWKAYDGWCRSTANGDGYARFWVQERSGHAPSFQRYIDSEIFPRGDAES